MSLVAALLLTWAIATPVSARVSVVGGTAEVPEPSGSFMERADRKLEAP